MAAIAARRNVTIFGVFNYKGGVGKSTNTINIAAALTHLGKNVLVVDADPQCNITTFYLSADSKEAQDEIGADDEDHKQAGEQGEAKISASDDEAAPSSGVVTSYPDDHKYAGNPILPRIAEDRTHPSAPNLTFDQISNFNTQENLLSLLNPAFLGHRAVLEQKTHYERHVHRILGSHQQRLFLIPGSVRADLFESAFEGVEDDAQFVYKLGAFRWAIRRAAHHVKAEAVIIDFGPSGGQVNKIFAMSCDAIIPPLFADYFSVSSADAFLTSIIPSWLCWRDKLKEKQSRWFLELEPQYKSEAEKYRFNRFEPRILPFLVTAYPLNLYPRVKKGNTPRHEYIPIRHSQWLKLLNQLVTGSITFAESNPNVAHVAGARDRQEAFKRVQKLFVPFGEPTDGHNGMVIQLFRDLGSMFQSSHQLRKAVVDLTQEDLKMIKIAFKSYLADDGILPQYSKRYKDYASNLIVFAAWVQARNSKEAHIIDNDSHPRPDGDDESPSAQRARV